MSEFNWELGIGCPCPSLNSVDRFIGFVRLVLNLQHSQTQGVQKQSGGYFLWKGFKIIRTLAQRGGGGGGTWEGPQGKVGEGGKSKKFNFQG